MSRHKKERVAQLPLLGNVWQKDSKLKGKWHEEVFGNMQPIVLELGCGKGEYAVNLAKHHPNKNFIGVDIKGHRLWVGATQALQSDLKQVAFLRASIEDLEQYFAPNEIDEIWITFPDPQLQLSRAKKRLTHPRFLAYYERIVKLGGKIHLKTDSDILYDFTIGWLQALGYSIIYQSTNLYQESLINKGLQAIQKEAETIQTYYEQKYLLAGKSIYYIQFSIVKHQNA